MKKLITLLLLTQLSFGQIDRYFATSISIDGRNAIFGSQPTENKPELDLQLSAELHLGNGLTWGFHYEQFPKIGYSKLSCGAGYVFEPINKIRVHANLETELIFRRGEMVEQYFQHNDTFIGVSVNYKVLYEIVPNLYTGIRIGEQLRGDLKSAGYNDYFKFNGSVVFEYVIYID